MKIIDAWALPDADNYLIQKLFGGACYQRDHLDLAMKYVNLHRLAVDGGAHIGTWTRQLSKWFDRVISFEPSMESFECLAYNVNGQHNIDLRNQALGKEPGRVRMTMEGYDHAIKNGNTMAMFVAEGDDVDRIMLDSLNLDDLDFLKLDVEGSEVDALLGAKETLLRCKPVVLFEDKDHFGRYGYGKEAPSNLLKSLGATWLFTAGCDQIWGWQ